LHTSDTANKKLTSRDTVAGKMATKKVEEYYSEDMKDKVTV